ARERSSRPIPSWPEPLRRHRRLQRASAALSARPAEAHARPQRPAAPVRSRRPAPAGGAL
ncbi:MAG: hypothetical protein AVDCRST_MAG53-594, partial [uncultured Solirubrobacteraceae bacterium]